MVYVGSALQVIDNSGAKIVECIKVLGNGCTVAFAGATLIVAVKRVNPKKRIKRVRYIELFWFPQRNPFFAPMAFRLLLVVIVLLL
jgi:Ribosomal protein L14p/L23e